MKRTFKNTAKGIFSICLAVCMLLCNTAGLFAGAKFLYGEEGLDYVEAYYFDVAPTIDGVVSESEWGEYTFELTTDSATVDSNAPYYNSFIYWKNYNNRLENTAKVWLRWDENHFYVAAKVRDYDGHSLKRGKSDVWNGDAIQFKVDPDGPNSITYGDPESYTYYDYYCEPWANVFAVPDIMCGYSQIAGGFVECYENTNNIGLTEYSKPVFGAVDVAVAPSDLLSDSPLNYSEDTQNGYTTYEMAIPWKYIYENEYVLNPIDVTPYTMTYTEFDYRNNKDGGIGRELGMSFVLYNTEKGSDSWQSFLSWGSGVCYIQTYEAPQTCKGSNSVTLSATKVEVAEVYPTGDVTKLYPEKPSKVYDNVYYDYLGNVVSGATPPAVTKDDLKTLTYDDAADMEFWGNAELYQGSIIDVGGEHGAVLNYDRMLETRTDEEGNTRYEGVDPIDQFYIDTAYSWDAYWQYPLSFTMEFDFMYTGTEVVQDGRAPEIGNLFGGATGVEYMCGYSFADKQFVVSEWGSYNPTKLASKLYDLRPDTWYNWKFQYDNDTCTVRFIINDEIIFNVYNRYFYYSNDNYLSDGTMMIFWMINTQCKFDNVKIYNFYDYIHTEFPEPPATPVENTTVYAPVYREAEYDNLKSLEYRYTYNSELYTLKGINGIDDSKFEQVTYPNGEKAIKITDLSWVEDAATGEKLFSLVFESKDVGTAEELLQLELDIKYENYNEEELAKATYSVENLERYKNATEISFDIKEKSGRFEFLGVEGIGENAYTLEEKEDGALCLALTDLELLNEVEVGSALFTLKYEAKSYDVKDADFDIEISDRCKYSEIEGEAVEYVIKAELTDCGSILNVTVELIDNPYELWAAIMYLDYNTDALKLIEDSIIVGNVVSIDKGVVDCSVLEDDHKFDWAQNKIYTSYISLSTDSGLDIVNGALFTAKFEVLDAEKDFGLDYLLWSDNVEYEPIESNLLALIDGEIQCVDASVSYQWSLDNAHMPGNWVIEKYPTETEDGVKVRKCELCGAVTETAIIPAGTVMAYTVTVNGVEKQYMAGETVELYAEKLEYVSSENKGYVFAGWEAEGVELENALANETSFVMPANNVVINTKTIIHGDTNSDGKVTALDVLALLKALKAADTSVKFDVNLDGKITALDKLALYKVIKGSFVYNK